jgi:hypothetical protein
MINRILIILALLLGLLPAQAQFQSVTTTANGTLHSPTNLWAQNSLAIANALAANPGVPVVRRLTESSTFVDPGVWLYAGNATLALETDGDYTATIINAGPGTLNILNNSTPVDTILPGESVAFSVADEEPVYTVTSRFTPAPLPTTNGLLARTGDGTTAARRLVAPAEGIAITNPDGVSGNITLSLSGDLSGLEGLTGTGLAARTGNGTWAARTITGTAGQIDVTNGTGTSGNPTLSLPTTITGNRNIGDSTANTIRLAGTSTATAGLTVEGGQLLSGMNAALSANATGNSTVMTQSIADARYGLRTAVNSWTGTNTFSSFRMGVTEQTIEVVEDDWVRVGRWANPFDLQVYQLVFTAAANNQLSYGHTTLLAGGYPMATYDSTLTGIFTPFSNGHTLKAVRARAETSTSGVTIEVQSRITGNLTVRQAATTFGSNTYNATLLLNPSGGTVLKTVNFTPGQLSPVHFSTAPMQFENFVQAQMPLRLSTQGSDPSAVSSNAVLFSRVSGGKVQLCVRFPTGAVQVISTEP